MKATLLALATLGTMLAQAPTSWTPEFSMQFKNVSGVVPSPDGSKVVWTQTQSVMDAEHSETLTHIFIANADGSHRRQLTRGDKSCTSPSFSPDGRSVYFLSSRSGKNNVYRIDIAGGEAEMLTDFKGGVGSYAVSPDGKTVAFTGYEPPADQEKNRKEKRDFRVVDANPENHALYILASDAANKSGRKLTDGKRHVTEFSWSPDSSKIAFCHWAAPGADNWTKSEMAEVDVSNGNVKKISDAGTFGGSRPVYSPDGRYLAFTKSLTNPPHWAMDNGIVLMTRSTGEVRMLPTTYDEQPALLGWTGGDRLLFSEAKHTREAIYEMPVDGPPHAIFEPSKGIFGGGGTHLNAAGTFIGMPMESPDEPPEAYLMPVSAMTPVRVSRANVDMPKLELGKTEVIKWKSKDGMDVEGLLTYPVNYEKGKKYPLILNIHGGPTGVFNEDFIGRSGLYPIAVFAARGYAVLRPNPTPSSSFPC